jgi:hypothetical protein
MEDCSYKAAVDKERRNMSTATGKKLTCIFLCIKFTKEQKENDKRGTLFTGKHKPTKWAMEPNIFFCMRLFSLFAVRKRCMMGGGGRNWEWNWCRMFILCNSICWISRWRTDLKPKMSNVCLPYLCTLPDNSFLYVSHTRNDIKRFILATKYARRIFVL